MKRIQKIGKLLLIGAVASVCAGCVVEDNPDTVVTPGKDTVIEKKETVVVPDDKPDVIINPPANTTG